MPLPEKTFTPFGAYLARYSVRVRKNSVLTPLLSLMLYEAEDTHVNRSWCGSAPEVKAGKRDDVSCFVGQMLHLKG